MTAAVIAFSQKGAELGERVASGLEAIGFETEVRRCGRGELPGWTRANFHRDALIFIGSCGIAVRAVAPLLAGKTRDPAVLVIDEQARHVIALLSGHIGGANRLTRDLARALDAVPVITTATDVRGVFAVDAWAVEQGLRIASPEGIREISACLLAGGSVRLETPFPVTGPLPSGFLMTDAGSPAALPTVRIDWQSHAEAAVLELVAPVVSLGIGCRRGTPAPLIEAAAAQLLEQTGCHPLAIARVCSIDLKADEPGLTEFCRTRHLPLVTYSARELERVPGRFGASEFVRRVTGVDNVCERSAMRGAGAGARLLQGKTSGSGVTLALAIAPCTLRFEKGELI